jgi:hypothetical protein
MKKAIVAATMALVLIAGVSLATDIQVLFSFSPEQGRTVVGYEMYSNDTRACSPVVADVLADGENWVFTCSGVSTGWADFSMRAVYENGEYSPFSAGFPFYVRGDGPVVIHVKVTDSDGQETIFVPSP